MPISVNSQLGFGVTAKDVILAIIGNIYYGGHNPSEAKSGDMAGLALGMQGSIPLGNWSYGETTIDLDWDDNGESDLWGYTVYRATVSGGPYAAVNGTLVAKGEGFEESDKEILFAEHHQSLRILGVVVNDAKPDGPYYSYYRKYYGEEKRTGFKRLVPRG